MKKLHRCSICKYGKSPCDWCWTDPDGELNFEPVPDAIETLIEEYEKLQNETAALRAQQEQQDNEPLEYEKYQCLECGHEWLEDCDASNYPDYCPGCGTCLSPQTTKEAANNGEMTIRDAIRWFNWKLGIFQTGNVHGPKIDATRAALSALRTQLREQENEPLTLDELRDMDGEPVWVTGKRGGKYYIIYSCEDGIRLHRFHGYRSFKGYGETWLAYRRKPGSVHHHET